MPSPELLIPRREEAAPERRGPEAWEGIPDGEFVWHMLEAQVAREIEEHTVPGLLAELPHMTEEEARALCYETLEGERQFVRGIWDAVSEAQSTGKPTAVLLDIDHTLGVDAEKITGTGYFILRPCIVPLLALLSHLEGAPVSVGILSTRVSEKLLTYLSNEDYFTRIAEYLDSGRIHSVYDRYHAMLEAEYADPDLAEARKKAVTERLAEKGLIGAMPPGDDLPFQPEELAKLETADAILGDEPDLQLVIGDDLRCFADKLVGRADGRLRPVASNRFQLQRDKIR